MKGQSFVVSDDGEGAGTSNTNLGATKYEFGGMYFAFFTVNTAKYSPKYFRICKYGPYLAFLRGRASSRSIKIDEGCLYRVVLGVAICEFFIETKTGLEISMKFQ